MAFPVSWTSLPAGGAPGSHIIDQTAWEAVRTSLALDAADRNGGGFNYAAVKDITYRRAFSIAGNELLRNNAAYNFLTQAQGVTPTAIQFGVTSPGGTMTATVSVTLTLTPVPPGLNGTDTHHYVYISGGTGAAEAVLITGGTAVSGSASGTIIFTPVNSHSGAWQIGSATAGIQEAVNACGSVGRVQILEGDWVLRKWVWIPGTAKISIRGCGQYVTFLKMDGTTGDWITYDTGSGAGIDFGDLAMVNNAGTYHTAGAMLRVLNRPYGLVSNVYVDRAYDGLVNDTGTNAFWHDCLIGCAHYGLNITSATQSNGNYALIQVSTNSTTAVAIRISGPTAGVFMTACGCGAVVNDPGNVGLLINQTSAGACNELGFANCIFDGHGYSAQILGYGSYVNNRILFSSCQFNASVFGLVVSGSISGLRMVNCTLYGGTTGMYVSDIKNSLFLGCAFNAGTTAGVNTGGVITDSSWIGCLVGVDNAGSYGFAFGGTQVNVVLDNKLVRGSSAPYLFSSYAGLIFAGDIGDGVVADAAALAFPINAYFTVTGTGTAVTSITQVWNGRSGSFRCTNAAPPQFTAGGNIGRTFTPTQNALVRYQVDAAGVVWMN